MLRCLLALVLTCLSVLAAVPTPRDHFGYVPGTDFKLANYSEIIAYFHKLASASDRIKLVEYGKTSLGRPSYVAFISSADNLRNLDRYREMNRRLALGIASEEEARKLSGEGKAIVWIDSGLHATEVAPAQHSPELAYRMLTGESPETRRIRENVILMQVPVINPDGLDMVVDWYRKNLGTPYELAPLPGLYQKYAGHDNNRDWFMLNLQETRNVSRLLFRDWFPHIVYNQHQSPAFPARIFVPPYAEPLNPNIPAAVMEGINLIGAAMKERFAREDKPGVLSYFGFDAWWNGGLRSVPAFHNMHGILTETALHAYGTPRTYKPAEFPERFGNGMPTKEPTVFYQRPWMGGRWGTREAIEYMLTADFAILDLAASRPDHFLLKAWQMARDNIQAGKAGKPYAWIIPAEQWDRSSAVEMLRRLQMAGIVVHRARHDFSADGKTYPAGSWVLLAAQPFRGYLQDLMEPQKYPEIRTGTTGPTKRPYDIAGWTLPMQMGVAADRVEDNFNASLEEAGELSPLPPSMNARENSAFVALAAALSAKQAIRRTKEGQFVRPGDAAYAQAAWELQPPRVALYQPWPENMDSGWTEWLLDTYKVPYSVIRNDDVRRGSLKERFDAVILGSQSVAGILHGRKFGERTSGRGGASPYQQREEFTGGIGLAGAAALDQFVREGGTLIAFDEAAELPVQLFGLPLRSTLTGSDDAEVGAGSFYSPGSILRITLDPTHPVALGMPAQAYAFSSGGRAWEVTLAPEYNNGDRQTQTVAKYAAKDVLASGWLSGERLVTGRTILAEARQGKGRVVLFGFRPQFRGQTFGTFKLVLNAIYLSSSRKLTE